MYLQKPATYSIKDSDWVSDIQKYFPPLTG